jgi:hypothetical protein
MGILTKLWGQRHAFRQWIELTLIIAVAIMAYFTFIKPMVTPNITVKPPSVTIQQNTIETNKVMKRLDDLEKVIKKQQEVGQADIAAALKEKDIKKSVDKMREAW